MAASSWYSFLEKGSQLGHSLYSFFEDFINLLFFSPPPNLLHNQIKKRLHSCWMVRVSIFVCSTWIVSSCIWESHILFLINIDLINTETLLWGRVDMVGTNHNKVLTQWRHMPMGKFRANIFLIRITSTYFWASEVFKNRSSKSWLFWLSGWNIWKISVN